MQRASVNEDVCIGCRFIPVARPVFLHLHAIHPITGLSLRVGKGVYPDIRMPFFVENYIRKTPHSIFAYAGAPKEWKYSWATLDGGNGFRHAFEKFAA